MPSKRNKTQQKAKAKTVLTELVSAAREVADGASYIESVFSAKNSEKLFGIFLMLVSFPVSYWIMKYINADPYSTMLTMVFSSLAALVGGLLAFRLYSGKISNEINNEKDNQKLSDIQKTDERMGMVENLYNRNKDLLQSNLDGIHSIADTYIEISKLESFTPDESKLLKEAIGNEIKRYDKVNHTIGNIQEKATFEIEKNSQAKIKPKSLPAQSSENV